MKNIILDHKIRKHLQEVLNEFTIFPSFGYCLILVGGPASGKTYMRNNNLPINGKIFDFDDFYKKYKQINDKVNRKESGEKLKQIEKLFLCNQEKNKNNVIFDICGRPERKSSLIEFIISLVKPLGYKIGLCWVVCNRSIAIKRNMERDRMLPDDSLHRRHNQILKFLPQFITSNKCQDVDDVWISFSSSNNLVDTNIPKTVKLKKGENGFIISKDLLNKIYDISGPLEKLDKHNPTVYYSSKEIKQGNGDNVTYLRNNINENIINESLTDIVYHFTTINKFENIVKNEEFILSNSDTRENDKDLNRGYQFYMSFTREHSVKRGYPATKNKLLPYGNDYDTGQKFSHGYYVRITFDGRKLNTMYKGIPVNYHYKTTRNNSNSEKLNPVYLQSEDRLVSNTQVEKRIFQCIINIDIYCPNIKNDGSLKFINTETMQSFIRTLNICNQKNINVRVYTDLKDFDTDYYGHKYISGNEIMNKLGEQSISNEIKVSDGLFKYITMYLAHLLASENNENIKKYIDYFLDDFKNYENYKVFYKKLYESVVKYIIGLKKSQIVPLNKDAYLYDNLNKFSVKSYYKFVEIFDKLKNEYFSNKKTIVGFFNEMKKNNFNKNNIIQFNQNQKQKNYEQSTSTDFS